MSTSTDAVLFYGYHLPEETEVPEAAYELLDGPVLVDYHCSGQYAMPYVYWATSRITARRGCPEPISPNDLDEKTERRAAEPILAFAREHGLPAPGEQVDDEKASELGWWLVSWWG